MSFSYRIRSFKRCFPYNSTTRLASFALYLGFESSTGDLLDYPLDKLGFEYGDCETYSVTGFISSLEIQYTQTLGLQLFSFTDEAQTFIFGYQIDGQAYATKRYEFDANTVWVGLHGVESNDGIEKIGIITMDPECVPIDGVVKEETVEETQADEIVDLELFNPPFSKIVETENGEG